MYPAISRTPEGAFVIRFDRAVYRVSAIKKAAYKFGSLFHILIEDGEKASEVVLKPNAVCPSPEESAGQFCNEVLDQELREQIAAETEGIRNLLLAHTFSKTALIDSDTETADYTSVDIGSRG